MTKTTEANEMMSVGLQIIMQDLQKELSTIQVRKEAFSYEMQALEHELFVSGMYATYLELRGVIAQLQAELDREMDLHLEIAEIAARIDSLSESN